MLTDWPPGPGAALDVDPQVPGLVDVHLDLVGLGQHDDRRRARVDAAARLRRRHALDPVHAALELEPAVRTVAGDLEDRLLDPADARLVEAHEVRPEAVLEGVARVHPQQLRREQRGLLAAGAGPDLDDDVAIVVGVARQERDTKVVEQRRLACLERRDLLARHRLQVVVGLRVAHVAGPDQLRADVLELAVGRDDRLEAGQLPSEALEGGRVRVDLGGGELRRDVVVLAGEALQLGVEAVVVGHRARQHARRQPGTGGSAATEVIASPSASASSAAARTPAAVSPGRASASARGRGCPRAPPRRRPGAPPPWRRSRPRSCRRSAAWW